MHRDIRHDELASLRPNDAPPSQCVKLRGVAGYPLLLQSVELPRRYLPVLPRRQIPVLLQIFFLSFGKLASGHAHQLDFLRVQLPITCPHVPEGKQLVDGGFLLRRYSSRVPIDYRIGNHLKPVLDLLHIPGFRALVPRAPCAKQNVARRCQTDNTPQFVADRHATVLVREPRYASRRKYVLFESETVRVFGLCPLCLPVDGTLH
jgi:hypothetical protein